MSEYQFEICIFRWQYKHKETL